METNFAVIVPMANEAKEFYPFVMNLANVLSELRCGKVYFIVDEVSKDNTRELCNEFSNNDSRFVTIWAPENKNAIDAYLRGYREASKAGHDFVIEMDAGMSHDPKAIPMFLRALNAGNNCVFGSRFIDGGSTGETTRSRTFLSRAGTLLTNLLLGTRMYDMTSGFQGFHYSVVDEFINYNILSKAHFYHAELRYLLRGMRCIEVPIHYRAPSRRVLKEPIYDSLRVLFHYFLLRLKGRAPIIKETNE